MGQPFTSHRALLGGLAAVVGLAAGCGSGSSSHVAGSCSIHSEACGSCINASCSMPVEDAGSTSLGNEFNAQWYYGCICSQEESATGGTGGTVATSIDSCGDQYSSYWGTTLPTCLHQKCAATCLQ